MNRILAAALALLLSGAALAAEPQPTTKQPIAKKASAPVAHGKPQAPATVTARLGAGRATVTVRFHSAATDASIEVHGVDGLVVTSAAVPLSGGRFARGETVTVDVAFTEGATPGQLAVLVSGDFAGARRNATAAFVTRPPTPEQLKPARGATTDSTGRRIKVMPSEPR
jgi:hypothetical protein